MNDRLVVFSARDGELFQNVKLIDQMATRHMLAVSLDNVEADDLLEFIYQWNDYGRLVMNEGIFLDQTTDPQLAHLLPTGVSVSETL